MVTAPFHIRNKQVDHFGKEWAAYQPAFEQALRERLVNHHETVGLTPSQNPASRRDGGPHRARFPGPRLAAGDAARLSARIAAGQPAAATAPSPAPHGPDPAQQTGQ